MTDPSRTSTLSTWRMTASRDHSFDIVLCDSLFDPSDSTLVERGTGPTGRALAVVDEAVLRLHGDRIRTYFDAHWVRADIVSLRLTEQDKSAHTLLALLDRIERFAPLRRSEPVLAVGGGAMLDVVGLACGLYRRGIPYVRVPTTLVGMVDVSVASKTAVNFAGRRNRLGMYHPPVVSLLDRTFLPTVDPTGISDGLGEVIKLAVVTDLELFELVERYGGVDAGFLLGANGRTVIGRSISGMVTQLRSNLWELELRRAVDFGHSFSPLVEMTVPPLMSHGQAVGMDVLLSTALAESRGLVPRGTPERIATTLRRCGLPTRHPGFAEVDVLWQALADVMRHRDGHQHLPLPAPLGLCTFVEDLRIDEVCAAVDRIGAFG